MKKLLATALLLAGAANAQDDEPLSRDALLSNFGWDFDAVEITTETVDDGLYVLFGAGGNIAVSVGEQGVLIVDDMFPELMPKIEAAIAGLGGDGVDFAVNTHWHFDHADGNLALGPAGTWIVAQQNSTEMMAKPTSSTWSWPSTARRRIPKTPARRSPSTTAWASTSTAARLT